MINNSKKYYDEKYDTGDYRGLYGGLEKHDLPSHYHLCASYIKDILLIDPVSKILDVGCGTGAFLYAMKRVGYRNIIGIDISDRAKDLSIEPEITFQGDAAEMNFENKSFDLIISIGVYEHIIAEKLNLSLKEIIRVGKRAVLWIDRDKNNIDHCFNEDEEWWAKRMVRTTDANLVYVDKRMAGGSGTYPILVNFELDRNLVGEKVMVIKKEENNHGR